MPLDVFPQMAAGHPARNELDGVSSNAQKGEDVWVCQVFPRDSLFAEALNWVGDCRREK